MHDNPSRAGVYAEGLAAGVVRYLQCTRCGASQSLIRYACGACMDQRLEWRDSCGRGVVCASSVVSRAPSDLYRSLVPYTLVLVDLVEGPRVMAHAETGVRIGDRVSATFFQLAEFHLVRFVRLSKGAG